MRTAPLDGVTEEIKDDGDWQVRGSGGRGVAGRGKGAADQRWPTAARHRLKAGSLAAVLVAASLFALLAVGPGPASAATSAVMVKDIAPGTDHSAPEALTEANGTLFFVANDGVHGFELWKSDGTTDGTTLVKDINPGPAGSLDAREPGGEHARESCYWLFSARPVLVAVRGTVLFAAADGVHGCELWKSDGTAKGTSLVADINPGPAASWPRALTTFHSRLYFSADDGVHGSEPWKSDGTLAGTGLLKDMVPGPTPYPYFYSDGFAGALAAGDKLFFIANDYDRVSKEIWTTDGTGAGTKLVYAEPLCIECYHPTVTGTFLVSLNRVAILGRGCCGYYSLVRSDGTPEGTYELGGDQINSASVVFKGAYYYFHRPFDLADGGSTLWRTDGTIEGTARVTYVLPDTGYETARVVNDRILFLGVTWRYPPGEYVVSLWASDGTAAGTGPVVEIGPGVWGYSSAPVGDSFFFSTFDNHGGFALWTSDGTATGTYRVGGINTGPNDGYPRELTAVGGTAFFTVDDGVHGRELWKTTPPVRSAYKNASSYCKALEAASESPSKNHGKCVSANH